MGLFFIITNMILTILVGMGVYSFTDSIIWAVLGALVITGSATANPIFALLAYPAVEFFFNDAGITIYSAMVVGLTLVQMGVVVFKVFKDPS